MINYISGLVFVVSTLPYLIFGLVSGALVDHFDRRRTLLPETLFVQTRLQALAATTQRLVDGLRGQASSTLSGRACAP